jgi:hypothetical protein
MNIIISWWRDMPAASLRRNHRVVSFLIDPCGVYFREPLI